MSVIVKKGTIFILRIFQRFRPVKFIEKLKTRVKNLKIEKMSLSTSIYTSCSLLITFTSVKIYFLR